MQVEQVAQPAQHLVLPVVAVAVGRVLLMLRGLQLRQAQAA